MGEVGFEGASGREADLRPKRHAAASNVEKLIAGTSFETEAETA